MSSGAPVIHVIKKNYEVTININKMARFKELFGLVFGTIALLLLAYTVSKVSLKLLFQQAMGQYDLLNTHLL